MSPYLAHVPGRGYLQVQGHRVTYTDDPAAARTYATAEAAEAAHPDAEPIATALPAARSVLTVRVERELLAAVDRAAARAGQERATWIRAALARAAGLL